MDANDRSMAKSDGSRRLTVGRPAIRINSLANQNVSWTVPEKTEQVNRSGIELGKELFQLKSPSEFAKSRDRNLELNNCCFLLSVIMHSEIMVRVSLQE